MKRIKIPLAIFAALVLISTALFFVLKSEKTSKELENTSLKYLKRPYITTSTEEKKIETLEELLDLDEVSMEIFLSNPELKNQLLQTDKLTDIVDSRKAISNLRSLNKETEDLVKGVSNSSSLLASVNRNGFGQEQEKLSIIKNVGLKAAISDSLLLNLGGFNFIPDFEYFKPGQLTNNDFIPMTTGDMKSELENIDKKLNQLLTPAVLDPGKTSPSIDFKGTWTKPDKTVLRWTPHNDWIPDKGYSLYRVVAGKAQLLAEGLGTSKQIDSVVLKGLEFSEYIKPVFEDAALTPEKLKILGIGSVKDFNGLTGTSGVANSKRVRITGNEDYKRLKNNLITVPATMNEKLPSIDALQVTALHFESTLKPQIFSIIDLEYSTLSAFSLRKAEPLNEKLSQREQMISTVLEARKSILSKAFTDDEFAVFAGLGYEDDLSKENLEKGTEIRYVLLAESSDTTAPAENDIITGTEKPGMKILVIKKGEEQLMEKPSGLEGYGIDNTVSIRWNGTNLDYDKSIISGYYIERKKKGEVSFKKVIKTPIAISYSLDETGIFFESPVFYIDSEVKNGEKATYRIQALDIFGRLSEYSDEVDIQVYKVKPPNTPNVEQPAISNKIAGRSEGYFSKMTEINKGKAGIIIPVAKTSDDTDTIVIFRCKALGTGFFDTPVEIARLDVTGKSKSGERIVNQGKSKIILQPVSKTKTDLVYFDGDVNPGCFYKYWAAGVDKVGNESAWSSSKILGVPLDTLPEKPIDSTANMKKNTLFDPSKEAPGYSKSITTRSEAKAIKSMTSKASNKPLTLGDDVILDADKEGAEIGVPISDIKVGDPLPSHISAIYANLPDIDKVHDIIALEKQDLLPDGSARVSWYHYGGKGLAGYHVYRAYSEGKTVDELKAMSRAEITESFSWKLIKENGKENQIIDNTLEIKDGRIYIYLICLVPEKSDKEIDIGLNTFAPGGWIFVNWKKPDDIQVSAYRVYKSEVPYFTDNQDTSELKWTLAGDMLDYTKYTEKVDQTFAHYYYFKVTSVSIWGKESEEGSITKIRVPATTPPQTPSMLSPLSQKGKIQVNWAGVPHASKYTIYRVTLPKIKEEDIIKLQVNSSNLYKSIFLSQNIGDTFIQGKFNIASINKIVLPSENSPILSADKFNTLQNTSKSKVFSSIKNVSLNEKAGAFKGIYDNYGPLALMPYGKLSEEAARLVLWEKVGDVEIPQGQDSTGLKSFVDDKVLFGNTYLYTVQAENDDLLCSGRPSPVSASPRKNAPFKPVEGLKIKLENGNPQISWNQAKDTNLTWKESREFIAGYIVYRSVTEDGDYYQASQLLSETIWADKEAGLFAENWYKVKVVDTAGFISDYSNAIKITAKRDFILQDNEKVKAVPSKNINEITDRSIVVRPTINPNIIIKPSIKPPVIVIPTPTPVPSRGTPTPVPGRMTPTPIPARVTPTPIPQRETPTPENTVNTAEPVRPTASRAPESTPVPPIKASPVIKVSPGKVDGKFVILDYITICDFVVRDLRLIKQGNGMGGTGNLIIADKYKMEVNLNISELNGKKVTRGQATIKKAVEFENNGITISRFSANPAVGKAVADGYISVSEKKAAEGQKNLIGDLYTMPFKNSVVKPDGSITILGIPVFHYGNLTFEKAESVQVTVADGIRGSSGYIKMKNGIVQNALGLETVDNKGLTYNFTDAVFGINGQLTGTMKLDKIQVMRLVVPAGLGIKAYSSTLSYNNGEVDTAASFIGGSVILPFKTFDDQLPLEISMDSAKRGRIQDAKDAIQVADLKNIGVLGVKASAKLNQKQTSILDESMIYMAERIQDFSLLILPADLKIQETLSSVSFNIKGWNGAGFMIKDTAMTPALVGNCQEETGDEIGVTPGKVSVDLDRGTALGQEGPEDTKNNDWTGILVKNGRVSLPPAYIMTDANTRIRFKLTPGELLYDRNGISYQNLTYSEEGIPANFGDALGGFLDVRVFDSLLDMYGNKVNIQINGDMGIPLFGYQKAKVKLYTSKETGRWVCSVAETDKFDPSGTGKVKMKISGGYLQSDGLHMNGSIDMMFEGKLEMTDIKFNELLVPSNMEMMTASGNKDGLYGKALFDKPYRIRFHDFDMDIRALSIVSNKETLAFSLAPKVYADGEKHTLQLKGLAASQVKTFDYYQSDITLWGGMQLSDNLVMDANEDFDRLVISKAYSKPEISYNESKSKMKFEFEQFASIDTVAIPAVSSKDEGIIEYNTKSIELKFTFASNLQSSTIDTKMRIGFDKELLRYFFALGIYYYSPAGISFGYGSVNNITGIIGYNLDLQKGANNRYALPKGKGELFNSIDDLSVNRTDEGNYFFAASAFAQIGLSTGTGTLPLGEIRDMYLLVEKGPSVEMGGDFYGPTDVAKIISGKGFSLMGTACIGYYHADQLFKFSLSLVDIPIYNFKLSGDLGFDMSPRYWEFRVGYPDMLIAEAYGVLDVGFGIDFKGSDNPDDSFIKAKVAISFDTGDITISPVYVRAYLYVGAEGQYYYDKKVLMLNAYLHGGVEGGIKAFGKKYAIIHLMLDANGDLNNAGGDWNLSASVRVYYSLDLWLDEIEGSVSWNVSKSF